MDWFTGPSLAIGLGALVVVGALIALGVRYLEARSRRDEAAARLQQAICEPLAHEPGMRECSVLPIVSLPMRGAARIELTGWVSSAETREAVTRAVQREAARLGQPVRVVDRLQVTMRRPA
jgi:predicted component of type VI protein secretion system